MYLISQTELHSIAGGLDSVMIDDEFRVPIDGVNEWCAVSLASAINWEIYHPGYSPLSNPFHAMINSVCTETEIKIFIQNLESVLPPDSPQAS